jgi:hypothetical protein
MQAAVFLYYREESYPQIHDNLDLFMAHYQMIKLNGGFFTHGELMPMLGGIDRNLLGSEFLLYNILYEIFPGIWAYILGYFLKIAIGIASFYLLSVELLGEKASGYRPVIVLTAVAYGLIPVFPTYGIAFTSVPLIAYFLIKLYRAGSLKKRLPWYVAVFMYPFLSYFSYHGFFILCYMCVAVIILWIRDKRFPKSTFASVVLLSLGYMAFEYRLFAAMLFDDTVTIRTTMDHGDITFLQALRTACGEFINASFHSQDSHMYLILPVTVIGLIIIDICYIRKKQIKAMFLDPANLIMYWIIFNCLIFGLYEYAPFRTLVETIVPKLTGFEFARTAYFNTLL